MYLRKKIVCIFIVCICLLTCHSLMAELVKEDSVSGYNTDTHDTATGSLDKSNLSVIFNQYIEAIEKKENEKGPYNKQLPEMLYSLGKKLQFNLHPNEAIKIYRKAIYINRINDGLYGLSQEHILRAIIESQKSQGKIKETAASYSQLLQIYSKNYAEKDTNLMLIMKEFGEWSLEAYSQTGGRHDAYYLEIAFQLYTDAIRISKESQGESHRSLLPLLNKLATTCYYLTLHQRMYPGYGETDTSVPFGYRSMAPINQVIGRGAYFKHGRIAQNKILQILEENPHFTLEEKAQGQINLGDWYLLFGKYQLAISAYKRSYAIVKDSQKSTENLDKIYSEPAMLPKRNSFFVAERSASIEAVKSMVKSKLSPPQSYVNLLVDITDGGNPVNINIQEIQPSEKDEYGARAIETIRSKKFRPRLKNGLPELATEFPIRVMIPNE